MLPDRCLSCGLSAYLLASGTHLAASPMVSGAVGRLAIAIRSGTREVNERSQLP